MSERLLLSPSFSIFPNQLWCYSITVVGSLSFQSSLAVNWSSVLDFFPCSSALSLCCLSSIIYQFLSCDAPLLITAIQLFSCWICGSWIFDLVFPHYSNISLALVLPISSFSSSHVCFLLLLLIIIVIIMSIFLQFCHPSTRLLIVVSFFQLPPTESLLPFSSVL